MAEKGHDGMAAPFGVPIPVDVEVLQVGASADVMAAVPIVANLPLFAGCMADMIEYLNETGQVEKFRDFLKGRLCDKHRELAPDTIFNDVPEVIELFHERLTDYLESLELERCTDHDNH